MDVEYDSDLEQISDLEIDDESGIQPYRFEPTRTTEESSDENSDVSEWSDSDDGYPRPHRPIHAAATGIPEVSTWCTCNNCQILETPEMCKCCQSTNVVDGKLEEENLQLTCITQHEGFRVNCLNRYVLETSYYEFRLRHGAPQEGVLIHDTYRHIAYRRFTRWVYGLLGKGVRKVIPACAVVAIRKEFPSQEYAGFKYPGV